MPPRYKYPYMECRRHPGRQLGYAVCIHVAYRGATIETHSPPTHEELGELLCVTCAQAPDNLEVDHLALICAPCCADIIRKGTVTRH